MTVAAARTSCTNANGAKHGAPRSPFQQAERVVRSQLGHGLSSHAIEHNPKYRALRGQAYRIAREIAIAREREAIAAADREGRPRPAIVWAENRPEVTRKAPQYCSNCGLVVKRPKSGRCRRCAQVWALSRGTRERPVDAHERDANAPRPTGPQRAVAWEDPALQFAPPDERAAEPPLRTGAARRPRSHANPPTETSPMLTDERREQLGELVVVGEESRIPAERFAGAILEALLSLDRRLAAAGPAALTIDAAIAKAKGKG